MNFLSQIFPERSAHRDGLDLFLGFRVHFREGDIRERFVPKNSYQPSIKIVVSCGAQCLRKVKKRPKLNNRQISSDFDVLGVKLWVFGVEESEFGVKIGMRALVSCARAQSRTK